MQFTLQTALHFGSAADEARFVAEAEAFCRLERTLYAWKARTGKSLLSAKTEFCAEHRITARAFNALRVSLGGKIEGTVSLLEANLKTQKDKQQKTLRKVRKDEKALQRVRDGQVRYTKPAFAKLMKAKQSREDSVTRRENAIARLSARVDAPVPGICFGTRKRFKAQFELEANRYGRHADWLRDWRAHRSDQLFYLGSKDETAGNGTCQLTVASDGRLSLKVRSIFADTRERPKYVEFPLSFSRDTTPLLRALAAKQALSYRFHRTERGWRVSVSFTVPATALVTTSPMNGVLALDFNQEHVAWCEVDAYGNARDFGSVAFDAPSAGERQDKLSKGLERLLKNAAARHLPVVIEDLDFTAKKRVMARERGSALRNRKLSGLLYATFTDFVERKCERLGLALLKVNPACTSISPRGRLALPVVLRLAAGRGVGARAPLKRGLPFPPRNHTRAPRVQVWIARN